MTDETTYDDKGVEELIPTPDAEGKPRTPEEYEAENRQLRREARNRRIQKREIEAKLAEYEQWKESQKTESQKLQDRAEAAEREAAALRIDKMRIRVAKEMGLDLDLADRIRGDSEEAMMEDARELLERVGKKGATAVDPFAGRRGGPVAAQASTSDLFRQWINQH